MQGTALTSFGERLVEPARRMASVRRTPSAADAVTRSIVEATPVDASRVAIEITHTGPVWR